METDSISPRSVGDQVKIAMNKGWLQRLGYRLPYPSQWRRISTAPYNRELELRTSDNGETVTLDFPCLRTREEAWINVDLGTEIKFSPSNGASGRAKNRRNLITQKSDSR